MGVCVHMCGGELRGAGSEHHVCTKHCGPFIANTCPLLALEILFSRMTLGEQWGGEERKLKLILSQCLTSTTVFSTSHWASPRCRRNFLWLHKSEALSGISLILSFCPSHRCSGGLIGDLAGSLGVGLHPFVCCGSFHGWNWSLGHDFGMNNA